jgi:hypothetical protein
MSDMAGTLSKREGRKFAVSARAQSRHCSRRPPGPCAGPSDLGRKKTRINARSSFMKDAVSFFFQKQMAMFLVLTIVAGSLPR